MSLQVGQDAMDMVLGMTSQVAEFTFFGGEPLLEFGTMANLVPYGQKRAEQLGKQARFFLITNGTLLSDEVLDFCRIWKFHMRLSLDGYRNAQDCERRMAGGGSSFDVIANRIPSILSAFPSIMLLMVITPRNADQLSNSIRELHAAGFTRFVATPNFETEWTGKDFAVLKEQYELVAEDFLCSMRAGNDIHVNFIDGKIFAQVHSDVLCEHQCEIARGEIAISASGNIYPCLRMVGEDTRKELTIGTIYSGIDEQLRRRFAFSRREPMAGCADCALSRRCLNNCGALNHALTGDIRVTTPAVCAHERMLIPIADSVANTLFEERNPLFMHKYYGLAATGAESHVAEKANP